MTSMDMLRVNDMPKCDDIDSLNYWNYVCCLVGYKSMYGAKRCGTNSPRSISVCELLKKDAWLMIYILSRQYYIRDAHLPAASLFISTLVKFCDIEKLFFQITTLEIKFIVTEKLLYRDSREQDSYIIGQNITYDMIDDLEEFLEHPDRKYHEIKHLRHTSKQYYPYNMKQVTPHILSLQIIIFDGQWYGSSRYSRSTIEIADLFLRLFGNGKLTIDHLPYKNTISPYEAAICKNVFCNSTIRSIGMNESLRSSHSKNVLSSSCWLNFAFPLIFFIFILIL